MNYIEFWLKLNLSLMNYIEARTITTKGHKLEDAMRMMQQQLAMMMKCQRGDASNSTSQVHAHYAEDDDHQLLP